MKNTSATVTALGYYNAVLGAFPFSRYAMISVPGAFGGMEHATIVSLADTGVVANGNSTRRAAIHELSDADRHPVGEAISLARPPVDFGVIHYASDTPYTQARTLGARGLSFFGMDATYAGSLAILRRILRREGAIRRP